LNYKLTLAVLAVLAFSISVYAQNDFNEGPGGFRDDFREFGDDSRDFRDDRDRFDERNRPDDRFDDRNFGDDRFDDRRDDIHRDEDGEDDEEKFQIFEDTLRQLGKDTSGLRNLIENDRSSKEDLYELFGENAVNQAVKAAGAEREFGQMKDFRSSPDKFEYERGYYGPPREEMMFGLLFQHIDDEIDFFEISKQCSDPEAIVDELIAQLKRKVPDFSQACDQLAQNVAECEERVERDCSQIGQPHFNDEADELRQIEARAWACPPDEDAIIEACVIRSAEYNKERLNYVDEICEERWKFDQTRIQRDCSQQGEHLNCDKDAYVKNCLGNMRPEDFEYEEYREPERYEEPYRAPIHDDQPYQEPEPFEEPPHDDQPFEEPFDEPVQDDQPGEETTSQEPIIPPEDEPLPDETQPEEHDEPAPEPEQESEPEPEPAPIEDITGSVILETYNDFVNQCERDFEEYEKPQCERTDDYCSREGYIQDCIRNEREWAESGNVELRINCKIDSKFQLREAQNNCRYLEDDKRQCFEEASRHCEGIGGAAADCRENLQESKVRAFLLEEVTQRCSFAGDIERGRRDADTFEVILAVSKFATDENLDDISKLLLRSEKLLTLENTIVIKGVVKKEDVDRLKSLPAVLRYKVDNLPDEAGSASTIVRGIANNLVNLGELEDEIPDNIAYVVESEAADIADISRKFEELEEIEAGKDFVYKFRRIFGLMKEAEEREIKQLEINIEKLGQSVESLKLAAAEVDDPLTKAVLLEQVDLLREQQQDISKLVIDKQKKALGILGILFG